MLSILDDAIGKPGLLHQESQGFFERQLIARADRISDLENSVQSLAKEVIQQDANAQELAKEVVRLREYIEQLTHLGSSNRTAPIA